MNPSHAHYAGHRFPAEIISPTVWLYFRFTLSFRDIEELMASRGVILTYESIRQWCLKFGQVFANEIRCRQPRRSDKWPLDEVYLRINLSSTISGGRRIRRAMFSISWCRAVGIGRPQTVLPQTAQGFALQPTGIDHRQAEDLCRCQAQDHARD